MRPDRLRNSNPFTSAHTCICDSPAVKIEVPASQRRCNFHISFLGGGGYEAKCMDCKNKFKGTLLSRGHKSDLSSLRSWRKCVLLRWMKWFLFIDPTGCGGGVPQRSHMYVQKYRSENTAHLTPGWCWGMKVTRC